MLWVRSYWVADSIWFRQAQPSDQISWGRPTVHLRYVDMLSGDGVLYLYHHEFITRYDLAASFEGDKTFQMKSKLRWLSYDADGLWYKSENHLGTPWTFSQSLGFHFDDDQPFSRMDKGHIAGVPMWFLTLLTAVLPARVAFHAIRRRRRARLLRCSWCGYDLRASPDLCPECGAAVVRSTPATPPNA